MECTLHLECTWSGVGVYFYWWVIWPSPWSGILVYTYNIRSVVGVYTPVGVVTEWLWSVHSKLECTLRQGKGMFKFKEVNYALRKNVNVVQPNRKMATFGLRSVPAWLVSYGTIILSLLENYQMSMITWWCKCQTPQMTPTPKIKICVELYYLLDMRTCCTHVFWCLSRPFHDVILLYILWYMARSVHMFALWSYTSPRLVLLVVNTTRNKAYLINKILYGRVTESSVWDVEKYVATRLLVCRGICMHHWSLGMGN